MLYTDGLVEAMSPSGEMFGIDRLTQSLAEGSSSVGDILDRAFDRRRKHVRDADQFDDTTIVCFGLDHTGTTRRAPGSMRRRPQADP